MQPENNDDDDDDEDEEEDADGSDDNDQSEILKVVSAVNTLVLFFCHCCANFWSVYAHRMYVHWCLFLAPAVLMFGPNSLGN